jgi:hypothetical protein
MTVVAFCRMIAKINEVIYTFGPSNQFFAIPFGILVQSVIQQFWKICFEKMYFWWKSIMCTTIWPVCSHMINHTQVYDQSARLMINIQAFSLYYNLFVFFLIDNFENTINHYNRTDCYGGHWWCTDDAHQNVVLDDWILENIDHF